MRIILYIAAILAANVLTAALPPIDLGLFIIPFGTLFIGFTFVMRDLVQEQLGRTKTYYVIITALVLSAISSYLLGDTLWIVFASAVSFTISETTDTEIYSRLRSSLSRRVLYSGLVGGTLDSAIFAILGLSPIGAGFLPWSAVPYAVGGQFIVKSLMQLLAAFYFKMKGERSNVV